MAEVECRDCRDYRKCGGKHWYGYQDIKFCRWQIIWVIEHLASLICGNWPDMPSDDIPEKPIKKTKQTEAYFTKPCQIAGDVEARLALTGDNGNWLRDAIKAGKPINEMDEDPKMALYYCEGNGFWRRKIGRANTPYIQWKADKMWRGRKIKIS